MPDFNKGDFTQQGVAGHVNANLRLNEKRLVNIDLTSNEEAEGCTITGTVKDLLNDKVYTIGSGVSGNIEITENGENINVAPYATATVNVAGGGDFSTAQITFLNTGAVNTYYIVRNYIKIDISGEELVIDNAGTWVYTEVTVKVPLYKGSYFLSLDLLDHADTEVLPSATGDITLDLEDGYFEITGDGTITLAGLSNGGDLG